MDARQKRRAFFFALIGHFRVMWPVLSGVLAAMIVPGFLIGRIEDWSIGDSLYFTFVTGFTIGYGDFTPTHLSSRLLAVIIGFAGIVLTGLVAAVGVQALRATEVEAPEKK
ncbi:potassium channel family protein [Bosea sp. 2KB_26]|uniref:potassium channel family protein n=1 Tax=Bosea sp. 2KB_26 TaxID=3237475 RepID=UPI000DE3682C